MTSLQTAPQPVRRRRRVLFSGVGVLVVLISLPSAASVLAPWFDVNVAGLSDPGRARWSLALEGSVDLLGQVFIVRALLRPERSVVLVQYLLAFALVAALVVSPFAGPLFLVLAGALLLVPLTYPRRGELLDWRSARGPSVPMLAVGSALAAGLLVLAVGLLDAQIGLPRGSAADFNIAATDAEHLLALAIAVLLAATRRDGWTFMAGGVTATLAYLGLASILLPEHAHSWGVGGGAAAVVAAAVYGTTAWRASSPRVR